MVSKSSFVCMAFIFAALLSGCGGSPEAAQARSELATIDSRTADLQAKVDALPAMEPSDDVRAMLEMEMHSLGVLSAFRTIGENAEYDQAALLGHLTKGLSAAERRGVDLTKYRDSGPDGLFSATLDEMPAYREDLRRMLGAADTFDSGVRLARESIGEIPDLTVPRQKDTERYFREHAEKKARYGALAASLEGKSSDGFREDAGRLETANDIFAGYMHFFKNMGSVAYAVPEEMAEVFPSTLDEAEAFVSCFTPVSAGDGGCDEESRKEAMNSLHKALYEAFVQLEQEV